MWADREADGSSKTTTPGILSDAKESELDEALNSLHSSNFDQYNNNHQSATNDEFPILDELDRLAKVRFKRFSF